MSQINKPETEANWHQRFLSLCNHIAQWSEDRDFQVGAVVVGPDHEIRSTGYNGFPRGVSADDSRRYDRSSGEKFYWFEHAERNAIYNAARMGTPLAGTKIYVNRYPCADCARAIIQSGITAVVCPEPPEFDGALDYSFKVSGQMLGEAGVQLTHL